MLSFAVLYFAIMMDAGLFDPLVNKVLAIVGESGSGKSASSMALLGLLPSNSRVTGEVILNGLKCYHDEVINRNFPQKENWFGMKDEEFDQLEKMLD